MINNLVAHNSAGADRYTLSHPHEGQQKESNDQLVKETKMQETIIM